MVALLIHVLDAHIHTRSMNIMLIVTNERQEVERGKEIVGENVHNSFASMDLAF